MTKKMDSYNIYFKGTKSYYLIGNGGRARNLGGGALEVWRREKKLGAR
jgi:hypothetical protein